MACGKDTHRCPGVHQCCHKNLLELLDFTVALLDKNGINYWLTYGTLLGAVRNNKMIPWDGDIDLGVKLADANRACKLGMKFINAGYGIKVAVMPNGEVCTLSIYYSFTNELHVEMNFYKTVNKMVRSVEFPGCKTDLENTNGLQKIIFEGKEYSCLKNPEQLLKNFYGSDWRTPKAKKWIKDRALKDACAEQYIIDALSQVGEYTREPGRNIK